MNMNQKIILLAVVTIIVGMLLYPPFQAQRGGVVHNMGYSFIFDPPEYGSHTATVNVFMLLTQWVGVLIAGGIAFFVSKTMSAKPLLSSKIDYVREGSSNGSQETAPEKPLATETMPNNEITPKGVSGWLLWLVISMMILGPLIGVAQISYEIMTVEEGFPEIETHHDWQIYKTLIWGVFFAIAATSFYGGLGFLISNDWAVVNRAVAILWVTHPGALLVLEFVIPSIAFGEPNSVDGQFWGAFIYSVAFAAIWTAYLAKSKRVRNTYCKYTI